MADITYNRTFAHTDWIDNEDVVQAGGDKGFNQKFHALEGELDKIGVVMGTIDAEIKKVQRLNFVVAQPPVVLAAATASAEFAVETYERAGMPPNVEKVYSIVILPQAGPTHLQHTILYRTAPGNKMAVSVQFFNPGAAPATFAFRVMTLATQT